ncbi:hypothetical protein [Rossellomorea sp. BNER]|uniref:hypothetical protein n=1 Tax=Rossellomorea sp. BNER TaxID=2962031 RepID=UPI003AF25A68
MFMSEKGFTAVESLVAFWCVVIIAVTLFPMLIQLQNGIRSKEQEVASYKALVEKLEYSTFQGQWGEGEYIEDEESYTVMWSRNSHGRKICVIYYSNKDQVEKKCIEEKPV